jgi:hypothetical protein
MTRNETLAVKATSKLIEVYDCLLYTSIGLGLILFVLFPAWLYFPALPIALMPVHIVLVPGFYLLASYAFRKALDKEDLLFLLENGYSNDPKVLKYLANLGVQGD